MKFIEKLEVNGEMFTNVPFEIKQLKELGLTDLEIKDLKDEFDLEDHKLSIKNKVGQVLSSVTKDTQTQTNLQAKFSLINLIPENKQSDEDKAIKDAIVALGLWVSEVMDLGNKSKKDITIPAQDIEWPVLEENHKAVIQQLVERF